MHEGRGKRSSWSNSGSLTGVQYVYTRDQCEYVLRMYLFCFSRNIMNATIDTSCATFKGRKDEYEEKGEIITIDSVIVL